MGIGLLQHNNMAEGLGAGLQGGLLAMNQGAENIADRQFKQKYYAAQGVPTEFRSLDMMARAAGYKPGSKEYEQAMRVGLGTEGRASSAGYGFQTVKGLDGRERIGRQNPRTGEFEVYDEVTGTFSPFGGAAQAPQPQTAQPKVDFVVDDPENFHPAVLAGLSQVDASLPAPSQVPAPVRAPANPGLGVSRTPEEQAALTTAAQEQAKIDAQLRNSSAVATAEADAAAKKAAAESTAKTDAELKAKRGKETLDAKTSLELLDGAEVLLARASGGMGEAVRDKVLGAFNVSTDGAKATAGLKILASKLVQKVPRFEGPQSNIDVQSYREAAGDLANDNLPVGTRMAALQELRRLNQKADDQQARKADTKASGDFSSFWRGK